MKDNTAEVIIFVHNGVVEGGFVSDSNIKVTICDFDSEFDSQEAENQFWQKCRDSGLIQIYPELYHPGE